jgi:hemolysin D
MSLSKHWDVFRQALRDEKDTKDKDDKSSSVKNHELAFLPAVLEVTETPASPLGRATVLAIICFFMIAIFWAMIGEMDIIATAQGKIVPTARVKLIQPLESGVIRAIRVTDGQTVKQGDVLVELDPTGTEADRFRLAQELVTTETEVARLDALLQKNPIKSFTPPKGAPTNLIRQSRAFLDSQFEEHQATLAALDGGVVQRRAEIRGIQGEISSIKKILPNLKERVNKRLELVTKGILARLPYLELEQEYLEYQQRLTVQKSELEKARSALKTDQAKRRQVAAEFRRDVLGQLSETRKQAATVRQELIKASDRSRLQTLTTPVDGVVQQLAVHTIGGVVTPAQELMVIVPANSGLEIEAMILNKDKAWVTIKQDAEIKVESFPFTKFGTIDGKVANVSGDAVQDENLGLVYPIRVTMAKTTILSGSEHVTLSPGMNVTIEVKTGKRKLIEYLLAPLQRYQDESMRER